MGTVTITLDGCEVSGRSGMTVLELAREAGVDIPTLCHHPYLTSIGACRLCLVENERSAALLVSCVTPIEPGMIISTRSPRLLERRQAIIELILASHPDACTVCDKGNRCQLHEIAASMGIGTPHFERIPQSGKITELNPFIARDMSKCILCAKCIRADHELVVEGAIDYVDRGFTARPATLGDLPLEQANCTFCGTCVSVCPTGALMEREAAYSGTAPTSVSTVCPFCGSGCSVELEVKNGQIIRARPGGDSPVNRGTLCVRGSYGYDFVHSPDRLTTPLVKSEEGFEAVSWNVALELVAGAFNRIKEKAGPAALGVLASSKCSNEDNYLLQRFTREVLATNNIDNGSRFYSAATRTGLGSTIGYPSTVGTLGDIEAAEVILVAGTDLSASAPAVGYAVKRAARYGGAGLILIDPRRTRLSPFARLWLQPKPGSEVVLLSGLAKVIVEENLLDEEFVDRRTDGFEALNDRLGPYTPDFVERISTVPAEAIRQAARLLAGAASASIIYGDAITQSSRGTDGVAALANLALLTGNIGRKGSGLFALQSESNALGACDMGALPDFLPGYASVASGEGRSGFEERWGVELPDHPGLTAMEMISAAGSGEIKGMYVVGENPAACLPDPVGVRRALSSLDFLVVQDIFLSETAKLATVVLPASSFAEKDGTVTNFEGRPQALRKAIEPLGLSRPDWQITLQLAEAMGSPFSYGSIRDVTDEIEEMVPFYDGIGETDREKAYGKQLYGEQLRHDGTPWEGRRLHGGGFPQGFGRFWPVEAEPWQGMSPDYPFALLTGSYLYHFGTGSRTSRSRRLRKFNPVGFVELSRQDAALLEISDGDTVKVRSSAGEVSATARVSDSSPEGILFMPLALSDSPANALFPLALDPKSKTPALAHCAVRLERSGPRV